MTFEKNMSEDQHAEKIAERVENEIRERMNSTRASKEIEITAEELKALFKNRKSE